MRLFEAVRHLTRRSATALAEFIDSVSRRFAGADDGERGQGMVEYALILVLIAVVVIVIVGITGRQVNNVFSNVSNGLSH